MAELQVQVSWDGVLVEGLTAVGPLVHTVQVITMYDGGLDRVAKLPGRSDNASVTLTRTVSADLTFDQWATGPHLQKTVDLTVLDAAGGATVTYRMYRCWVSGYAVAPDLEALTVTESLTLTMDGFQRVAPPMAQRAEELAVRLQREVRRISVRSLVGATAEETRLRVDEMLQSAGAAGDILLFDEADALFTRRTEVTDAHDRYAAEPMDVVVNRLSTYAAPVLVVPLDGTEGTDGTDPTDPQPRTDQPPA